MRIQTKYRQIEDNFSLKNPLFDKLAKLEPKATYPFIPITWHKAVDFSVMDDRGNKWIDLTSAIFVTNAGHANPKIKQAIKDQVDADLLFAYNYPTEIKYKFISKLLEISPKHFKQVGLLNSGSEAMDIVYKLVKQYGAAKKKKYIIAFRGAYHGRGLSNDLISGSPTKAEEWSRVTDPEVHFIDFPYEASAKFDPSKLPPPEQIAGFILETFQGWGAWFYPKGFVNELYAFARQHGALVCFDEMQAGFYRLGPLYGYQTYGAEIEPDILGLGKGISSSLPLAAVLVREGLIDIDIKADLHGTQSGNAVACAAGLANIEFLSSAEEVAKREKTIALFNTELQSFTKSSLIKQVNVRGLIAGVIFHKVEEASRVVMSCVENGVLPVCTNKVSIKLAPPLTINEEAIKEFAEVFRSFL
jgi:acetylornithine/succinyldiaminopimelate/putrescine aminotransferase